ncbi:ATP-binding protein [Danxiaibacter flavus]|uniref:ATP-binding protein n=1 Tax=Danxiaibacter flavus TaxID=3049108 RepID=A0ABV3ZGG2_9BACT|nr:ATP-binding protein [Chitinophagaceae bacterium DXS]
MTDSANTQWVSGNQKYLSATMSLLYARLSLYKATLEDNGVGIEENTSAVNNLQEQLNILAVEMKVPAALDNIVNVFGLSSFEKDLLVTCAAVELDSSFASLIAGLQGNVNACLPTFSLVLASLPGAHWSALSPNAPLRYWRLIELNTDQLISKAPIRIDEHILHYLAGVNHLDERLTGIIEPASLQQDLVPSHIELAKNIIQTCLEKFNTSGFQPIQLSGDNKPDKNNIAVYVCRQLGFYPYTIPVHAIPSATKDIVELARLWNREAALKSYALMIDNSDVDTSDRQRMQVVNSFIGNIQSPMIVNVSRATLSNNTRYGLFEVAKPTSAEQLDLWKKSLEESTNISDRELNRLVAQFNFSAKTITDASRQLVTQNETPLNGDHAKDLLNDLWKTCCIHSRPDIGELAHRIEAIAQMDDLILPEAQKEILRDLIIHTKYRAQVYNDWGFAQRNNRGLGITAIFAGESGTGKTMASEVLAKELKLDLYRIDLSQVVNKYIGETEKNLKRIFDAAEDGGAILLFDEADALFGKRSEVKDSHDRYANVEISYLLQRMEAYRGLAILTTNMKNVMDKAWMRRIRFVVQFPFPDIEQRAEIWKRIFPSATPLNNLDIAKLARLNIAGGNIKNIAMNAAFIAASEGDAVSMQHVQRALRSEYEKIEKSLTNTEIGLLK